MVTLGRMYTASGLFCFVCLHSVELSWFAPVKIEAKRSAPRVQSDCMSGGMSGVDPVDFWGAKAENAAKGGRIL